MPVKIAACRLLKGHEPLSQPMLDQPEWQFKPTNTKRILETYFIKVSLITAINLRPVSPPTCSQKKRQSRNIVIAS